MIKEKSVLLGFFFFLLMLCLISDVLACFLTALGFFTVLPCCIWIKQHCTGLWRHWDWSSVSIYCSLHRTVRLFLFEGHYTVMPTCDKCICSFSFYKYQILLNKERILLFEGTLHLFIHLLSICRSPCARHCSGHWVHLWRKQWSLTLWSLHPFWWCSKLFSLYYVTNAIFIKRKSDKTKNWE